MSRFRATLRVGALIVVTAMAALPPAILRRVGARRARLRVGSRCCRLWGRAACAIMGIRRVVQGRPSGEVFVVTSNHLSYVDILVLSSVYPSLFVAKREIADWPVFGWVTRSCGTLFVDRERTRDVVRVGRAMGEYLEQGIPLTLFPEGKATNGAEVLPFLPSLLEPAARTGVPCFAASLAYEVPGSRCAPSETVCWHSGASFVPHIWRLLQFKRIEVDLRFSDEPIHSTSRKELAVRLRDTVVEGFSAVRQHAQEANEATAQVRLRTGRTAP